VLAALAAAAPGGSAALPSVTLPVKVPQVQLPVKDGAVGDLLPKETVGGVVDDVVNQPLPDPVESVVESSPVAPVRDEVRRVVSGTTGGGSGGGSGGSGGSTGTGSGAGGGGTSSGGGGTSTGGTAGTPNGGSRNSPRGTSGGGRRGNRVTRKTTARRGTALRRAAGVTPGRGSIDSLSARGGSAGGARAGSGNHAGASGDEGGTAPAAVRTIETAVNAVPTAIWIALGVLSLLAIALAGRMYVERRRARSLAVDRALLMGDVAALERALLPAIPDQLGSVAISVAYRSCEGPAAGGDFYDAFELPGGRAAVIVGDISGHGPDALEGTNSVRAQLHALLETGMTPRAAIAMVGERSPIQLAGRFSTVIVAIHDPVDGTLTFATAGHPPPIIAGAGADELLSTGSSPPIGVALRTGVRETTVALPPGSTCCLYTDGIVEAKNGEGMIGRERLAELVAELDSGDRADVLLARVLAEAHHSSDDMTICLLRPVVGAAALPPRIELLEFDADDVESGFAERFLDVCGVPEAERAAIVEQASAAVRTDGIALLEVTVGDGSWGARVIPAPARSAPAAAGEPA
jgi:serine phosphatase RsbU (regulator of sigma subunit)